MSHLIQAEDQNWVRSGDRSHRRRLMAILRLAHRVLGVQRKGLGLGTLGVGGNLHSTTALGALTMSIALGFSGAAHAQYQAGGGSATGGNAVAIGNTATANGNNSVALGTANSATGDATIAIGYSMTVNGLNSIGIGVFAGANGVNALAIGGNAQATADGATSIGVNSVARAGAAALGLNARADGVNSTAVGYVSRATGLRATALGFGATASGLDAIAQGNSAVASNQNAIAIGFQATATAINAVNLGNRTVAGGGALQESAIAIGTDVLASQVDATAIGRQSRATGTSATAMGRNASAWGNQSIALGLGAIAGVQANTALPNSIAIGTNAVSSGTAGTAIGTAANATADFGTALGNQALASGVGALAAGSGAQATATSTTALGNNATATALNSIALGLGAAASGINSAALGVSAVANGQNAVALGIAASASGLNSVYLGARTVGTGASGASAIGIGTDVTASQNDAIAMGRASQATAASAIAMGNTAIATSDDAVAIGTRANAGGGKSVAIGADNVAYGDGAVSIGDPSYASGTGAFTGGANNIANADGTASATAANMANGAVAIGNSNVAIGQGSVALGNTSRAGAAGAVALGDTAVANNADDVALGSGSVTDVAVGTASTVIAGTTYNFAGTATPSSTVSIGAAGAERTLTNVAAGRISAASTDGINGSQLFATNQAVESVATTITNINSGGGIKYFHANSTLPDSQAIGTDSVAIGPNAVANNAGDVAIGLNSVSGVTTAVGGTTIGGVNYAFAGGAPAGALSVGSAGAERQVQNVAAGQLSGASTDAVNGSQLFATNQQVTTNTTDIANLGASIGDIGDTINNIAGDTSTAYTDANGDGIRYVRTNDRTLAVSDSSAQGVGSTAVGYNATAIAESSLALGRESQSTILGGVALGSGSVSDRVLAPATGQIAAGPTNFIEYNTTDKSLLGAVSVGTATSYRQITNVADGTDSQDAVTIRQLQGAIASVAATPSKYFHANSVAGDSLAVGAESIAVGPTTVVNGDNGVGIGNGAIVDQTAPGGTAIGQGAHVLLADGIALGTQATAAGIQSVALGAGADSNHINSVALGAQSVTTVGAQTGYTAFALAAPQTSFGEVSIGGVGTERKLTNLAAGSAETDAVNVSQLRGLGTQITNNLGGGAVVNPDGTITGPTYNIQGGSYTTVYDGFTAVDASITNLNNQINNGGGIKYFHANSTLADSSATGTDSVAIGPESIATGTDSLAAGHGAAATGVGSVALGEGAQANNANDVALGSGSVTETAVGTAGTTIRGKQYDFAGTTPVGTVSVGADGAERTITNVAAGRIAADSTDAINGSQLHATNSAIEDLEGGIGSINNNAVFYDIKDGKKTNNITLQGGDVNAPVVISNVGKGVADNDAVNVSQLKENVTYAIKTSNDYTDSVATTTLNEANSYTDQKFGQLNQEFDSIRDEARQAAAIGLAAASLRYDDRPGKVSVAVGGGYWRDAGALAFGTGYTSENGRVRANLSGTTAGGHWGVGAGLSFTLN
ncbi:YadA-like family protein [Phyllobacterium sp. CCNWLW183]